MEIVFRPIFIPTFSLISFDFTIVIIFSIKQMNKGSDKVLPCHPSFMIFDLIIISSVLITTVSLFFNLSQLSQMLFINLENQSSSM